MDTLLTLVIALGGIAKGVGAIWTAIVARRQAQLTDQSLTEQRQSLKEQTEIARHQAQVTEQNLTEQNDRARLTLEYDLLSRMMERAISPHWLSSRKATAKFLLEHALVDDNIVEVPTLTAPVMEVCSFFQELGEMQRLGVLSAESVWNRAGLLGQAYWLLCKPTIEKKREEWKDPSLFEDFEYLSRLMAELDRERGTASLTQERLRQIMETEAAEGEEPPTMSE